MDYELVIIGAGPAGYAAGIYAGRSGISSLIVDKGAGGGLAAISPNIENYPGFISISGFELTAKMQEHAGKYAKMKLGEEIVDITKNSSSFVVKSSQNSYRCNAVLLCTGTEYRSLGVDGEQRLRGRGVSYCATCDGFFFKEKTVAVIGGGNSALIEAIYLVQIRCKKVFLIHRRDQMRADQSYQDEASAKGVKMVYNAVVQSIKGDEQVESLQVMDTKNNTVSDISVDGVFVSIGEIPQNKLAKKIGVSIDKKGYVIVDGQGRTNISGVYAAGDITGGLRQVITACAKGAVAALASTEVLGKKYPY
ncbi:MAG: FAD-dependent oxidoreductase [Thermoplasmatota archaeon]